MNHKLTIEYFILVNPPDGEHLKYSFDSLPVKIGRSKECQIQLPHKTVSRFHAQLIRGRNGVVILEDTNSTNGTFIGSVPISSEELLDASEFYIGQVQCLLTVHRNRKPHPAITNSTRDLRLRNSKRFINKQKQIQLQNINKPAINKPARNNNSFETVALKIRPQKTMSSFVRRWTYMLNDKPQPAVSVSKLVKLAREGIITPTTLLIAQESSSWQKASDIEQLKKVWKIPTAESTEKPNQTKKNNTNTNTIFKNPTSRYPGAGIQRRIMATLIDTIILINLTLIAITALYFFNLIKLPQISRNILNTSWHPLLNIIQQQATMLISIPLIITTIYYIFMDTSWRRGTFGKRIMGLEITNLSGNNITMPQEIIRFCTQIISITSIIGILIMQFTKKKQTLHDLLSQTLVVKTTNIRKNGFIHLLLFTILCTSIVTTILFLPTTNQKNIKQKKYHHYKGKQI